MASYGHRALLRLRRLPASQLRRLGTAAMETPAQLPAFMLSSSPMASSSRLTLDSFFSPSQGDDLWSTMNFARDDELVAAALAPPNSKDWLDPASAYLGLRGSGLFSHYLQVLLPRIRTLYANLRPAGMHRLLISDLLLRNPDPRALREILLEETDLAHQLPGERLPPGLLAQVYRVVAPSIRRRTVAPLSRPALVAVSHALRAQGSTDLLSDVFFELAHSSTWEPDNVWPMLDIVLHLARRGKANDALRLLQYPIALGKLPASSLGRSSASHPEAATLMAQSAVVRTALTWKLDTRASRAVDDMIATMQASEVATPALELVYTAVRSASMSHRPDLVQWAGATILRLAADERFPPIPSAELDLYLSALPTSAAIQFYSSLPAPRHGPPGPHHILRLALAHPSRQLLKRLVGDLGETTAAAQAAVPGVLRALASARMLPFVRTVYDHLQDGVLDAHTALTLVRASTRGARSPKNTAFAHRILGRYLASLPATPSTALVALHGYALVTDPKVDLAPYVQTLLSLGSAEAQHELQSLVQKYPLLAHRLAHIAREYGLDIPSPALAIAAACSSRHWGALAPFQRSEIPTTEEEKAALTSLMLTRKGRMTAAARRFVAAAEAHPGAPILVPTAAAIMSRAEAMGRWESGLDVLVSLLKTVTEGGGEDIAEVVGAFLSHLRSPTAVKLWATRRGDVAAGVQKLAPAPRLILEARIAELDNLPESDAQKQ